VSDLQNILDGNVYHIDETNATPGQDLKVDFVSVSKFDFVHIIARYEGGAAHSVSIQLYAWDAAAWHTWDSESGGREVTMANHSFHVPCGSNYIGTGGNDGQVRVRFNHTQLGVGSHDTYIDSVALYNLEYKVDRHWGPWR
jgi:hypothetical protein